MVSDRNVIDTQLQEAIFAFERTTGVVATITNDSGAKSGQLAEALAGGKKIVVCTIQTFPFTLKAVQELAATTGKRFAVIADEAHSSQTGEAAAKLKQVLSAEELAAVADGGEIGTEDILAAQMAAKGKLLENTTLAQQAANNHKEQFGNSPNLMNALMDAIIDALDAHSAMSKQALDPPVIQKGLKDALMGPGRLYEALRERAA